MKKVLFLFMVLSAQGIFAQPLNTLEADEAAVSDEKPTLLDTIQYIRQKGDKCMVQFNYDMATFYYRKLLEINISDSYALSRLKEAEYAQKSLCKNDLAHAEKFFYEKAYIQAVPFYKRIVERGCNFATIANERLVQIKKILKSKKKDVDK